MHLVSGNQNYNSVKSNNTIFAEFGVIFVHNFQCHYFTGAVIGKSFWSLK